jgi:hypothetical protein
VDTTITVSGFDVTKKLKRTIDQSLANLYEQLYGHPEAAELYTMDEVLRFEDGQKLALPAYARQGNENAVYKTWADFVQLNPRPNQRAIQKRKQFRISYINERGKEKTAPAYYARVISFQNKLYYNMEGRFYEMTRKNNDFYVSGKTSQFQDNSNAAVAGAMFGIVGAVIASSASNGGQEAYECKIHYKKGNLIPIRAIPRQHQGGASL